MLLRTITPKRQCTRRFHLFHFHLLSFQPSFLNSLSYHIIIVKFIVFVEMPPSSNRCCEEEGVCDFKWGNRKGIDAGSKDTVLYESFVYDGVEYFLYDCVYFYHTDHVETSIGKLVKMFERDGRKMIDVVWFFRPMEIRNFHGSYKPFWNELFLASGKGIGVSNCNLLESIIGKCSVVCTSEDKRNPKLSEIERKKADFYFKCTFNVDRCAIEDKFPDTINGIEVEQFFNKKGDKKTSDNLHLETSNIPRVIKKIKIKKRISVSVKENNEVIDEARTKSAPSDILHRKVEDKDELTTSKNVSHKILISENFSDENDDNIKTAPSGILHRKVEDKDELRTSKNVSPKTLIRTSENFREENDVNIKTAPCDILHRKVEDKDELRTSENVPPKTMMRTSDNFRDKNEANIKTAPSDMLCRKIEVKNELRTSENLRNSNEANFKTAPSDMLCRKVEDKDELRTSENVSSKIKITSENFRDKDGAKIKIVPSDSLHRKVEEKDQLRTSENVPPKIKIGGSKIFKDKDEVRTKMAPFDMLRMKVKAKDEMRISENVSSKILLDSHPSKKRKFTEEKSVFGQVNKSQKKEVFDRKEEFRQDGNVNPNRKVTEVTERPNAEKRKWFKKMPWEGRLQKAQELDTLVLLNNLDPSYTSFEVEDLVWHALKEKVEARMIESTPTSNTYYGRALVIFRTKDAASNAIFELTRKCLVLEDGRVVTARKGTVRDPVKQSTFTGHLTLSRAALHKQSREMRNAVSTSHCSQPNTIEYAMAIEWAHQYDKSEACWKALIEKQMKEIEAVNSKFKTDRIFFEDS
ncbi:protein ANTI-SILENCING 1-like [Vicia villosa]|uniref:protein ANTI-SILENCING 1-like n=1 Tax=Vicia villosa TaxID=3911 RepID=UPI00273AE8C6|nr:protein ANTI-SILENCING 1-like [Vicia villosa]XP_058774130.1 protein ANTI-SILENCING 1-like [Vicia villosa]